jgi:predicted metal-binding membrane protein
MASSVERAIVLSGLAALVALAWLYLASGAGMGTMPDMADMPMPPSPWALSFAMWAAMMVAMMTPSATPAILLYGRVHGHATAQGRASGLAPTTAFAAGYLLLWVAFSALATSAQVALEHAGLLSSTYLGSRSRWLSAGVLALAGAYQLSPLKHACLARCRAPAAFISRHWRPGVGGALRLGALHGTYCLGCCWLLMALLFVGGVMNLAWIAALTLLVLAEKLLPRGEWLGRASGVVLLAASAVVLLR